MSRPEFPATSGAAAFSHRSPIPLTVHLSLYSCHPCSPWSFFRDNRIMEAAEERREPGSMWCASHPENVAASARRSRPHNCRILRRMKHRRRPDNRRKQTRKHEGTSYAVTLWQCPANRRRSCEMPDLYRPEVATLPGIEPGLPP